MLAGSSLWDVPVTCAFRSMLMRSSATPLCRKAAYECNPEPDSEVPFKYVLIESQSSGGSPRDHRAGVSVTQFGQPGTQADHRHGMNLRDPGLSYP